MEMPQCNTQTFQLFLDSFAQQNPLEYKIIVLDNGAFHKAKTLHIPHNIVLLFLPPYSPELNPAEKIWQRFKRNFSNKVFPSLLHISQFIDQQIDNLSTLNIISTCSFNYIFQNLDWAN